MRAINSSYLSLRRQLLVATMAALPVMGAIAAAPPLEIARNPSDLTELSLNDLMQIQVTSVSKSVEPLSKAAAAIYVLTGEQIRRSGVRSIAEALRMVPGMQVARTNQGVQQYAISARGFNSFTADKLEVLLDGRSVYSPLFSGVFWDTLDTYLPDIDRIEVIRGPGAALWGANAVNGVINIVTKSALDTLGTQVSAGGGTTERVFGSVRTGARLGDSGAVRLYAQSTDRDDGKHPDGSDAPTQMRLKQAGVRSDWHSSDASQYTVEGDVYSASRLSDFGTTSENGSDILGRWSHKLDGGSELSFKSYFDRYHRLYPQVYEETRDTVDLDLEHRLHLTGTNEFLYGFGYRNTRDDTGGSPLAFQFDPVSRHLDLYSAFAQDQIGLADGAGTLTLGSKFEHNDFSGFEVQPSIRLGWQLHERLFTWGAISRAVRSPNRLNSDLSIFGAFKVGNPQIESEKLVAYEWGLRYWTNEVFSADLALFYNDYTDLLSSETTPPPFGMYDNKLKGTGRGGELNLNWHPMHGLELRTFYAYLALDLSAKSGSTDTTTASFIEQSNPRHNGGVEAKWDPVANVTLDGLLRYVSAQTAPGTEVPGYTDLNLRAAWRFHPKLEVALVGSNLLHPHHAEFGLNNPTRLEAARGVFAQIDWTWE